MVAHICLICDRLTEPPFGFMMRPTQGNHADSKAPVVICQQCMERGRQESSVDQIEHEILQGTICHLCFEPLCPPGGTTMSTRDGRRLLRVCWSCKEVFHGETV